MATVHTELEDRWQWVSLNRPEKRNALNPELIAELDEVLKADANNPEVRVVILTGEGKSFCAGLDLESLQQMSQRTYEESLEDSRRYAQLLKRIYLHPKPVIAALNGDAVAGGCGLALACDITVAASTAKLGYTETKIGFVPAIVSFFLIRSIGEKQARELLLTGRLIEAAEARQMGLVHEVVDPADLRNRGREIARQLCENSPQALETTKKLVAEIASLDLETALSYACEVNARSRSTSDCIEGLAAFLEKRPPRWK